MREDLASSLLLGISRVSSDTLARAFIGTNSYKEYQIPKNSGGYRTISEPPPDLKNVQENILAWLQRLEKRQNLNNSLKNNPEVAALIHDLDYRLHGSRLSHSVATAAKALTGNNFIFLTKLDIKSAFPSVNQEILEKLLKTIILDECRLYYWRSRRKIFLKAIPVIIKKADSKGLIYPDQKKIQLADKILSENFDSIRKELQVKNGLIREFVFSDEWLQRRDEIYQIARERGFYSGHDLCEKWQEDMYKLIVKMGFSDIPLSEGDIKSMFSGSLKENAKFYLKQRGRPSASLKKRRLKIIKEQSSFIGISHKNVLRQPLFPVKRNCDLHALIWEKAKKAETIENSILPEIIDQLARDLARLVTYHGILPQGAPTSGFLLNLVISEIGLVDDIASILNATTFTKALSRRKSYYNKEASLYSRNHKLAIAVYVDDIAIATMKRPSKTLLLNLEKAFSKGGIFRVNRKKTKVYDLRNFSAPILGMKLTRRLPTPREETNLKKCHPNDLPRGYSKASAKKRPFYLLSATLSQAKQKQYRAFFHRLAVSGGSDEDWKKAEGCFGHIISVYGGLDKLPSCLKSAVREFRKERKKE